LIAKLILIHTSTQRLLLAEKRLYTITINSIQYPDSSSRAHQILKTHRLNPVRFFIIKFHGYSKPFSPKTY